MPKEIDKITNKMKQSCLGKIGHRSRLGAEYVLSTMKPEPDLSVYKCEFCELYHIGHSKNK